MAKGSGRVKGRERESGSAREGSGCDQHETERQR